MWVRRRSLVIVPPEGGLESRWDSQKRLCFIHVTVKIVSGLPYKIIIESWNTHAPSSSQEAFLCHASPRGLRRVRKIPECTSYTPIGCLQDKESKMQGWYTEFVTHFVNRLLTKLITLFFLQTTNAIPKINFVNRLLTSKFLMSIKTDKTWAVSTSSLPSFPT